MNVIFAVFVALFFLLVPPIPQDPGFHRFVDARALAGVPNFWNVASNLPFLFIGVAGLLRAKSPGARTMFAGILLTALGSAYYHLAPSDATLVWDRLPMTVIFMSFLVCALDREWDVRLLVVMVGIGVMSVLWWHWTGDLRCYALVKFGPMFYLLPKFIRQREPMFVVALFLLAQGLELADGAVYSYLPLSGHTLKHLAAEAATLVIYFWKGKA